MYSFNKTWGLIKSKAMYEWNLFSNSKMRTFYGEYIDKNSLCFDIGAHLGNRTQLFFELGNKVIAVEPQPYFYNYLQQKFQTNEKVIIEQLGIGDKQGEATFYISTLHPTISTFASNKWKEKMKEVGPKSIKYDKEITVDINTLDYLIEKHGLPHYCKLDIEGLEYAALCGLSTKIPLLSFEFMCFTIDETIKCMDKMTELGYTEFNYFLGEKAKFNLSNWCDKDKLIQEISKHSTLITAGDIFAR